jgi:hypothetical protein
VPEYISQVSMMNLNWKTKTNDDEIDEQNAKVLCDMASSGD